MDDRDEFLAWVRERLVPAERALHDGDPEPRRALWSRREPVSVLGAWQDATGVAEADDLFDLLGRSFSRCTSYEMEVVVAEVLGDLAWTAARERTACSVDGEPRSYTLRVTQVYRREDGSWRVAHRHGSAPPER